MLPIIGLTGERGTGKDTAAAWLGDAFGFERMAFADPLKDEVAHELQLIRPPSISAPKDILRAWSACLPGDVHKKPTSPEVRRILQWYGTEYRRGQDPDHWINRMEARYKARGEYAMIVVSDLRFANEADWVRSKGGQVWKIEGPTRGDGGIKGHASEDLSEIAPDLIVYNTGSIEEFCSELKAAAGLAFKMAA